MNVEQFDNELFNLSQQADNANAMPFNEAAWQRMEQLLDGDKKKRRFVLWWWLLPLLLVGGGAAFYINSSSNSGNKIVANSKINQESIIENNSASKTIEKGNNSVSAIKIEEDKTNEKTGFFLEDKNTIDANKQQDYFAKRDRVTAILYKSNNSKKKTRKQINSIEGKESVEENFTELQNNLQSRKKDRKYFLEEGWQYEKTVKIRFIEIDTNSINLKHSIVTSFEQSLYGSGRCLASSKPSFLSKFELSAFISADATTASFNNTDKKSVAYGFGLSYQLSKKLSIATGFGISRKLYSADSADYKNQPTVLMAYKLQSVDANCLVYEVPVNLQYQFAQRNKNSWVAIGGISTYFMKSEAYDYNYLWYGQARKTNYVIDNKNNQLFSILNLAIGYRRQVSKQLSYQLSPFIKVPLTGIGEGKVNLYSAGLQLSVNLKGK